MVHPGQRFEVSDSARDVDDGSADTRALLEQFGWTPQQFEAICHAGGRRAEAVIEFPSPCADNPRCSSNASMTWYAARDEQGELCRGPAMVLLDILHAGNLISGYIGRAMARKGIHGFVLDLPHSRKRSPGGRDCMTLFHGMRQAVADARRARDVVAAMPNVDGRVGIQGTSFGGFVASVAAGLDRAFDVTCLALCGGNLHRILTEGKVESAKIRRKLADAGMGDPQRMQDFLWQVEPMRVAHRLNADRTWMWVARRDQVVPLSSSRELADAAGLGADHFQTIGGCHYTCCLGAPLWTKHIIHTIQQAWSCRQTASVQTPQFEGQLAQA